MRVRRTICSPCGISDEPRRKSCCVALTVLRSAGLSSHGTCTTNSEVVKTECGLKVAELLEKAGTPVQTMTYQMGHSTHPAQMKQTAEFVKACLGLGED